MGLEEEFMFVFLDGPFPGEHIISGLDWPLPEVVFAKGYKLKGAYEKIFESKGKPKPTKDRKEYRGAQYKWNEDRVVSGIAK